MDHGRFSAALIVLCMLFASLAALPSGARADEGATDGYGYYWTNSDVPSPTVTFDWVDVSSIGTDAGVSGDDAAFGPYPLGFEFEFYGEVFTMFNISTNGLITFGGQSTSYTYDRIPSPAVPNGFLAPYWANLCVDYSGYNTGRVYYTTQGTSPNLQTVIEFHEVSILGYTSDPLTFEVVICETGEIWFNYLTLNLCTGSSAVVGIESPTGEFGVMYSYVSDSLHDSLAVMFSCAPVSIGPSGSLRDHAGTDVTHPVYLWNHQSFDDGFGISVATTSGWTVTVYDDTMTPLPDIDTDGVFEAGTIASGSYETLYITVSIPTSPICRAENVTVTATSLGSLAEDDVLVTVYVLPVLFVPPYTDYGNDTDSDGLYDFLVVEVPVEVCFGGEYLLYANLCDSSYSFITDFYATVSLAAGSGTMLVSYNGVDISNSGIDGPYIASVSLFDPAYSWQLDSTFIGTGAYLASDFELAGASFVPPMACAAVDANSNGLYDLYQVTLTVSANTEGTYYLTFDFLSPLGASVSSTERSVDLTVGLHDIVFYVSGPDIYNSGRSGEFTIRVEMFDYSFAPMDYLEQTTEYLYYYDFEGDAYMAPPTYDWGVDYDGDTLFDVLAVSAVANTTFEDYFTLTGSLCDDTMTQLASAVAYPVLSVGSNVVTLEFPSGGLYSSGYSGQYTVTFILWDSYGVARDTYEFQTSYHTYDEFDFPAVQFTPPHEEAVTDPDSDGLLDSLMIGAHMTVNVPGDYTVRGYLYDSTMSFVTMTANSSYLSGGEVTVWLEYSGWVINTGMYSGPFTVMLYAYDSSWGLVTEDEYTTLVYLPDDWEPYPATITPPMTEQAVDSDLDGHYDFIYVNVTVEVVSAGTYVLNADLYDPASAYVATMSGSYDLEAVTQTVSVLFPSKYVCDAGYDGSYQFVVALYTGDMAFLDSEVLNTSYYYALAFDGGSAVFVPPCSDRGEDLDSDGLYDDLVVDCPVLVAVEQDYTLMANVLDASDAFVASLSVDATLGVGEQVITLRLSSAVIFLGAFDGPYRFDLLLFDYSYGMVLQDSMTYYTSDYLYTDFDVSGAVFDGPQTAVAVDGGAGFGYAGLQVTADLMVYSEGVYVVMLLVYDVNWDFVCSQDATAYLATGSQQMGLFVPGWKLATAAASGTFVLSSMLFDGYGTYLDYDVSYTDAYDPADFDPTLPLILSGFTFAAPEVDGSAGTDEWAAAVSIDLSAADPENAVAGTLLVMHDWSNVYLCFDMTGDTTADASDCVSVTFDTGERGVLADGEDDMFELDCGYSLDGPRHSVYNSSMAGWAVDCMPFDGSLEDHAGLAGAYGFGTSALSATDHRVYEFSIPLALLNASLDDVLGFATSGTQGYGAYDGSTGAYSEWPARFIDPSQVQFFGSLSLPGYATTTTAALDGTLDDSGWYVSEVVVTLSGTPSEGVANTMYSTDGGSTWTEYGSPFTLSEDGEYAIEFYSVDFGGLEEEHRTVTLRIDATAPTSTAAPTGTAGLEGWYTSPVVVEFDGSDGAGSGISEVRYRIDGGTWALVFGVSVSMSMDGAHTLEYYAVDGAGNEEALHTLSIGIDTVAPVTVASVDGSTVNLTASDSASGLWVTLYRIDGGQWTEYTAPFNVTGAGNHTVEFYSSDVAGNTETIQNITVENESVPTDDDGSAGPLGLPWLAWIGLVAALAAVVAIIAVPRILRKGGKAKEPDAEDDLADEGSEEAEAKDGESVEDIEDELDRLAEELDRK